MKIQNSLVAPFIVVRRFRAQLIFALRTFTKLPFIKQNVHQYFVYLYIYHSDFKGDIFFESRILLEFIFSKHSPENIFQDSRLYSRQLIIQGALAGAVAQA